MAEGLAVRLQLWVVEFGDEVRDGGVIFLGLEFGHFESSDEIEDREKRGEAVLCILHIFFASVFRGFESSSNLRSLRCATGIG